MIICMCMENSFTNTATLTMMTIINMNMEPTGPANHTAMCTCMTGWNTPMIMLRIPIIVILT
jgi:hypothetical protein